MLKPKQKLHPNVFYMLQNEWECNLTMQCVKKHYLLSVLNFPSFSFSVLWVLIMGDEKTLLSVPSFHTMENFTDPVMSPLTHPFFLN